MNAEERALFIQRKLKEQWPTLHGVDGLEVLLDEPELVVVQVILSQEFEAKLKKLNAYMDVLHKDVERKEIEVSETIDRFAMAIKGVEKYSLEHDSKLKDFDKEIQDLFNQQASLVGLIKSAKELIKETQDQNKILEIHIHTLEDELKRVTMRCDDLEDDNKGLKDAVIHLNGEYESLEERLESLEDRPISLSSRFISWLKRGKHGK